MYLVEREMLFRLYESGIIDYDDFKACNQALDEYEKLK